MYPASFESSNLVETIQKKKIVKSYILLSPRLNFSWHSAPWQKLKKSANFDRNVLSPQVSIECKQLKRTSTRNISYL